MPTKGELDIFVHLELMCPATGNGREAFMNQRLETRSFTIKALSCVSPVP